MNALEIAIKNAYVLQGSGQETNKVYLEFIKANFLIPVDKNSDRELPEVLYLQENEHTFLPVFTTREHFDAWAREISDRINLLNLTGVDLLKGIGEEVRISLNIGSSTYKEFHTAELARMRSMVLKFWPNRP